MECHRTRWIVSECKQVGADSSVLHFNWMFAGYRRDSIISRFRTIKINHIFGIVRITFGDANRLNLSLEWNMVNIFISQSKVANYLRNIKFSQHIMQADYVVMFSKLLALFSVNEEQLTPFSGGMVRHMLTWSMKTALLEEVVVKISYAESSVPRLARRLHVERRLFWFWPATFCKKSWWYILKSPWQSFQNLILLVTI